MKKFEIGDWVVNLHNEELARVQKVTLMDALFGTHVYVIGYCSDEGSLDGTYDSYMYNNDLMLLEDWINFTKEKCSGTLKRLDVLDKFSKKIDTGLGLKEQGNE